MKGVMVLRFYIADLHFGHEKVIRYDNRPFTTMEQMQELCIRNWNSVVGAYDEVFVLGDMFLKGNLAKQIMPRLNGTTYLILGNHDRVTQNDYRYFGWVKDYAVISDGNDKVVLFHYPIAHWRNADHGYVHLYGHIHKGRDYAPYESYKFNMAQREQLYECYNVGCMLHNYTPITLEELRLGN